MTTIRYDAEPVPLNPHLRLILVLAPACSFISYHSIQRRIYFFPLLLGLLIFEVYDHSRRELVPHVYQEVVGETHEGNSTVHVTHSKNPRKDSTKM